MDERYFQLRHVTEVQDASDFTIPRAKAVYKAVIRHRDYKAVQLLRDSGDAASKLEYIIVEVECDGVPPQNEFGINYRERLVLCVSENPKLLVEVRALRKDFPLLMHQNQSLMGHPASLCLYFDSPRSVLRTWTPEGFLRRIQWWLENSARGELHPTDQPVEHLFFATIYELVLPWNFEELQKDRSKVFVVARGPERTDHGLTCFLTAMARESQATTNTLSVGYIPLVLPPLVHGRVERDPQTLGDLADILSSRGIDLGSELRTALQKRVGEAGEPSTADDSYSVILLHTPICRSEGAEPVSMAHRAFVVLAGPLKLGSDTGALLLHDNRYFKDVLNRQPSDLWRCEKVMAMDVLRQNDAESARRQSGILDAGPEGVLIGAGALGSAMLNIWSRGGWGRWLVIDKDHVKPHNLSRHTACALQIGSSKATAVAELQFAVTEGAINIIPLCADACDFTQEAVTQPLTKADLVIDASTTLEYPRVASTVDSFARHISVFITPNGNSAVLLAEDAQRTIRLRTLEAQYYRAVIQEEWGRDHLSGNIGSFWSGASCRDISMVMPYARIMAQAGTLSEQIPMIAGREDALIRVWQRDSQNGQVEVFEVPVAAESRFKLGDFDLFIDCGVDRQLRDLRSQRSPDETGGVLLGYYDFNVNAVVVVAGLPAPPDSQSSPESFKRGIIGLVQAVSEANKRTAGGVQYIGEWHSHPPGHNSTPSRDDLEQLIHLAFGMADDGLPAVQLIVGDRDLQVIQMAVE